MKNMYEIKGTIEFISECNTPPIKQSGSNIKQIAINEMNSSSTTIEENNTKNIIANSNNSDNYIQSEQKNNRDASNSSNFTPKKPTIISKNSSNNKKDIYMVTEGYHKTDSCYYKTPDGGFHKLPPDSYHKMSEICYNKLPDGSFKRLDKQNVESTIAGINGSVDVASSSSQNRMRNQMIKFLKRSKSHSQATARETGIEYRKEIHQLKNKAKEDISQIMKNNTNVLQNSMLPAQENFGKSSNNNNNQRSNSMHTGNQKVVITMMENGGLPIVATSKNKSPKSDNKIKVNSVNII